MPIDEELAKMLGLDQGALSQRAKGDRDWSDRLLKDVIEPFDVILKEHASLTAVEIKNGITHEMIREGQEFNDNVSHSLAMLLVLFVVSNIPHNVDKEGHVSLLAIKLLSVKNGLEAEAMLKKAKALGPLRKEGE